MKKRLFAAAMGAILSMSAIAPAVYAAEPSSISGNAADFEAVSQEELAENRYIYENDPEGPKHLNPDGTWRKEDENDALVGDGMFSEIVHDARFENYDKHVGIDVSWWENVNEATDRREAIDWKAVKASGRDFAIIRIGFRARVSGSNAIGADTWGIRNLEGALNAGMKVGVYIYSQALNEAEAIEEANWLMEQTKAYHNRISLGFVMDYEFADQNGRLYGRLYDGNLSKDAKTACVKAFCEQVKARGLHPMLYGDTNFFKTQLHISELENLYDVWMARYNKAGANYSGSYKIWQYGLEEFVPGIPSRLCDADVLYEKRNVEPQLTGSLQKMFRLYNPNSGEHFYTAAEHERNVLLDAGWKYEGVGWKAPVKSAWPVYRLYNANAGDHHYTTSAAERDHLIAVGWKDEGIGWYSASKEDGIALYRQYNPNAKSGAHNWTVNFNENQTLVKLGWRAEGISWYGAR